MVKVVGNSDPQHANQESIRGILYKNYNALKIKTALTIRDNGIHASNSAWEAMRDRLIWHHGSQLMTDFLGSKLLNLQIKKMIFKFINKILLIL